MRRVGRDCESMSTSETAQGRSPSTSRMRHVSLNGSGRVHEKVRLEEGLERTVRWYRDNEAWWRKLEWMKVVPVRTASGEVEYH